MRGLGGTPREGGMPSENRERQSGDKELARSDDSRGPWERPALRRLVTSEAAQPGPAGAGEGNSGKS